MQFTRLGTVAQVRIARPTDRLEQVTRFYCDLLGLARIGGFRGHDGHDGIMIGLPGATYHLEFTHRAGGSSCSAPGPDNLLVLYLPDEAERMAVAARLEAGGHPPVEPDNPYWRERALTFADPDGWHVVLCSGAGVAAQPEASIEVAVTKLEMTAPPARPPSPAPTGLGTLMLMRAERPGADFYRYLYTAVGAPWQWYQRRLLDDAALAAIIEDPDVRVQVLWLDGVPVGYFEIDNRAGDGNVELAYFGLMSRFTGLRLGPFMLDAAIRVAWSLEGAQRMWVSTCSLDHPKALQTYQRAGFVPFARETIVIPDPSVLLAGR